VSELRSPEGDLESRVASYLQRVWGEPVRVADWRRYPVGLSWTTIGFTAHVGKTRSLPLVLRLGDPGGLFAPYTARPEYLVLTGMADVPSLPLPPVHAYSDDTSVLGAPFLLVGHVPGDTPMPWSRDADAPEVPQSLADDFADALAAIHAFDWVGSELAGLQGNVPPQDVAVTQVRHWACHAGLLQANSEDGDLAASEPAHPQMHYAMRWLEAHAPSAERVAVVHGDYRVGNFLQQGGRITAILDWETVHLGDPHEDLAWALSRAFAAGTTRVGGLFDREAFLDRYQARSGIRIRPGVLRYYDVFVQFKIAAMQAGARRRVNGGRASDVRTAVLGFQLPAALLTLNRLIAQAEGA
jgi:aminoglycoside phosphotransferase (APT) family kinase protein